MLLNLAFIHRQTIAMPALVRKVNITQIVCASYSIIDPVLLEVEDLEKRRKKSLRDPSSNHTLLLISQIFIFWTEICSRRRRASEKDEKIVEGK